ncbi:glycolate oxidase FAD binding subunit [Candidatus Nitrotoga sp. BS]|uniref:glycolate oxidase subunit GlcE n=1 Tax=Candidatus Nitrotoga sp. BS TaxID=2890408 RepID=UPI001EF36FE8|nr:glycolate oxidase subunit GlcE [Candidatus Nitrotoga sp. BS]CAH1198171.1 glycolate oxidase FAD binding subunit [Candidatus Nitrotoga sp. BS]
MLERDISETLQHQVHSAIGNGAPLKIEGGNSKAFLGRESHGEILDISAHCGIVEHDPRELVLTARSGTPLKEIETALAEAGQMLAFEPPHFGENATLGGTIACGLSGPRRPFYGSARDFVLGCKLINGEGEIMRFGGQVIKNVAGYDVSRLMVGAYGTLGVLLEISLKVLPRPAASRTLIEECTQAEAIRKMSQLLSQPVPVDAACYHAGHCYLRLSGSEQAVKHAHEHLGGEMLEKSDPFWHTLREHHLPFFDSANPLYRVMVKPAVPPLEITGEWLLDWGGAQRWLVSDEPIALIRERVANVGGHVTQFRGGAHNGEIFQPLAAPLLVIHQRLKVSFDPHGIFNQGRIYANL